MMRSATLLEGCLGRVSGLKSKRDTLITRAKDKKGGKSGPAAPIITADVSDAPKELGMARIVYFWNKFALRDGDKPATIGIPWKEGEEPRWFQELTLPPETIVDPVHQLDPEKTGARRFKKTVRRLAVKEFNQQMVAKNFDIIRRNIKQLPP